MTTETTCTDPTSQTPSSERSPSPSSSSQASSSAASSPITLREVELAEATPREIDGRHLLEVTLIRAGTSRNGNHYPPEVLREALPLFEGARAFVDHQRDDSLPERSVRDLVGYYRGAHLDQAGRLRAQLHLLAGHEWLFSLLREAENNPNLCGLSIDADGDVDRRPDGRTDVRRLYRVSSVDVVTRPSAGGQVNRIIQSDRPAPAPEPATTQPEPTTPPPTRPSVADGRTTVPDDQQTQTPPANSTPLQEGQTGGAATTPVAPSPREERSSTPTNDTPDLAQLLEQLKADRERLQGELSRVTSVLAPAATTPPDPGAELTRLAEEIKRDRDMARASQTLDTKLREAVLPVPVEAKLRKSFEGRIFETSTLETAIAEEKSMLAALTSAGLVTGNGMEKPISVGMSEYDQVQAAFDALFDIYESEQAKSVPRFSGIREAFRICTGVDIGQTGSVDRPLREAFAAGLRAKVLAGQLKESEAILREADVTTASFSYLLGTSMNKRLLSDYQAWPSEWQKFCTVVGIKDFKQQDRVRLGAFGSLSTVAEDTAYTTVSLADTRAIYSATKRGNLVQISRETIVNDDLYAIRQIPQKLAVAAAFTLAEFVYGLLSPNGGNIYDGFKLFDTTNHLNTGIATINLGTANSGAALSSAALQTAVIKMRKQTNMASKPIGLKPRYLLVPPDLEFTAMTILKSAGLPGGNNNDINPMLGYAEPIVAPQLNALTPASTTVWMAIADPRVIDTIEVGFVGGQANPVLLIQDMPLMGLNFTQDVISYKVRHEYGGAVVDYRGFYLGNN